MPPFPEVPPHTVGASEQVHCGHDGECGENTIWFGDTLSNLQETSSRSGFCNANINDIKAWRGTTGEGWAKLKNLPQEKPEVD